VQDAPWYIYEERFPASSPKVMELTQLTGYRYLNAWRPSAQVDIAVQG
jgi:hypothetical protein